MAKAPAKPIEISVLNRQNTTIRIVADTPLILNSMSAKTRRDLLIGSRRKTQSEKAALKHQPMQEFVDSIGPLDHDGPTAITFPASGMKQAMTTAAIATDGVTKAGSNRLIYVAGERLPIYGIPELRMDIVRQAGMNRAPDIRTRCQIRKWATEFTVHYVSPEFSVADMISLVMNAGIMCGIGDYRQEKGAGNYGLFRIVDDPENDLDWKRAMEGTRERQLAAIADPAYANPETSELMEAFDEEVARRSAA